VQITFWSSATIRALSDSGRLLALYLITSPHCTITGVYRLPDGYACDDLQWTADQVGETLSELFENGFATRCSITNWVWVRKFLDWNKPENPNQIKAAVKVVDSIPANCVWLPVFMAERGSSLGLRPPTQANRSETLWEGLPQPFRNQKQEQEQEQEQNPRLIQEGTELSVSRGGKAA
jgi:hypothetical protein